MIISKDKSISISVGSNQNETIEDFVNAVIEIRQNKPTTEINIDYYNELKAKADKWDDKETPLSVVVTETAPYDEDDCEIVYSCAKCNFVVYNEFNYCHNCGQKLDWEE